jgi:hypothetical protein
MAILREPQLHLMLLIEKPVIHAVGYITMLCVIQGIGAIWS